MPLSAFEGFHFGSCSIFTSTPTVFWAHNSFFLTCPGKNLGRVADRTQGSFKKKKHFENCCFVDFSELWLIAAKISLKGGKNFIWKKEKAETYQRSAKHKKFGPILSMRRKKPWEQLSRRGWQSFYVDDFPHKALFSNLPRLFRLKSKAMFVITEQRISCEQVITMVNEGKKIINFFFIFLRVWVLNLSLKQHFYFVLLIDNKEIRLLSKYRRSFALLLTVHGISLNTWAAKFDR